MARTSEILKSHIGIAFSLPNKPKIKIKILKSKQIDELLDVDFNIPGIPKNAIIKEVVVGEGAIEKIFEKYK